MKIGALGPRWSYSSQVADKVWWDNYEFIWTNSNKDTVIDLEKFDIWILPISNKYGGTVTGNMEIICQQLKLGHKIYHHGSYNHKINHVLAISQDNSMPGRWASQIERVYSHPQALLQCSHKIHKNKNVAIETNSTTEKIWDIWDSEAVICSRQAAESHGLIIVDHDYAPVDNETSFAILSSQKETFLESSILVQDKIIAILELENISGRLGQALWILTSLWLNLCFIESVANGKGWFVFPIVAQADSSNHMKIKQQLKEEFEEIYIL